MKMQLKPIVALASGAILLFGAFCQTSQAQTNIIVLPDVNGNTGDTALTVETVVTEDLSDSVWTYNYQISNPSGDPASVTSFTADFNAGYAGLGGDAVLPGTLTGGAFALNGGFNGVTWFESPSVAPGSTSGTLQFQSDFGPTTGNADANGSENPPSPWASDSPASQILVPNTPSVIPEPATTTLLAMTLLLVAFRPGLLKKA
jgi:hypothetical protein